MFAFFFVISSSLRIIISLSSHWTTGFGAEIPPRTSVQWAELESVHQLPSRPVQAPRQANEPQGIFENLQGLCLHGWLI